MKRLAILLILLLPLAGFAQNQQDNNKCFTQVNGYTQVRMETNYKSNPNFYIRRTRLWIDGHIPYNGKGEFLFRTKVYFTKGDRNVRLMDAKVGYRYENFQLWVGQQVPDFGRQITQGDSKIPLGERARYNYYLTPGEEGLLRDIGVQAFYKFDSRGHVSLGYFNGYFANNYLSENYNFLITHRFTYDIIKKDNDFLALGYSVMYRRAVDLEMPKILTDTFTGNDFRYELEFEARLNKIDIEAGYVRALLKSDNGQFYSADGFYTNFNTYITNKDIAIVAVDYMSLPDNNETFEPWYVLGYSHLFKGNKVKLSINQWFQYTGSNIDTYTRMQLQIFLH